MLLEINEIYPYSFQNYKYKISLKNRITENKIYELKISIIKDITNLTYYHYPPLEVKAIIVSHLDYLDENKEQYNLLNSVYIVNGIVITGKIGYSFEIITKLERI
jgi:hypothetical protein